MDRSNVLTVLALSAIGALVVLTCSDSGQEPPPSQDQQIRELRQRLQKLETRVGDLEHRPAEAKSAPAKIVDKVVTNLELKTAKEPLESVGVCTLTGKVIFDGKPPERKHQADRMKGHRDSPKCNDGDSRDPLWIVDKNGGVANVVIWLKPANGKFFVPPRLRQIGDEKVIMDQPHCAFEPHVVAFQPSYFDPVAKKQQQSGQILEIRNSAQMNHNVSWHGNRLLNPGMNWILKPKGHTVVEAMPCKYEETGKADLLSISCDIHKWMTAKAAVFDHPYFAVTNAKGEFEIKDIPANTELTLAIWHESMDPDSLSGAHKELVTFGAGKSLREIKLH
ncbi:hypothetical protein BH10PLA2_BH10PLA2_11080 [soil metagenome]